MGIIGIDIYKDDKIKITNIEGSQVCEITFFDKNGKCIPLTSKNFNNAIKKIYNLLKKKNKLYSKARFVCAISVALPDGSSFEYQGKIEGNLSFPARGKKGFGYDPIFVPKGYAKTFAQISKIKKNQISHRYKAFIQIKKFFKFS